MKKCKTNKGTCPFLYEIALPCENPNYTDIRYMKCALGYHIVNMKGGLSKDCKLEVVQYALKDNPNSITFMPDGISE